MPQSQPPLIELEQVGYRQGAAEILADISWRLERGERWALLGPNGCGKTTLLRIACGYLWPSSGFVRRLGEELVDLSVLRRSIGWVAPDLAPRIPPRELAVETVVSGKFAQVGLKPMSDAQPTRQDFDDARALLAGMHCESLADKPFGVLSQGERQQTLVARARMVDPLMIVLDEPCAGMDPGVRERFLAWLGEVASATGRTAHSAPPHAPSPALVFVTHHVEEIMPAFDRTLVMQDGRVRAAGLTADVITPQLLGEVYNVTVARVDSHHGRLWPLWSAR
jgi:iron complex transport system ATP-binding protein